MLLCRSFQALASYEAHLDIVNIQPEAQWIVCGEGFTPLHLAALRGDFNIVKLLLAGHVQAMAAGMEVMAATAGQWGQRQAGKCGRPAGWVNRARRRCFLGVLLVLGLACVPCGCFVC